MPGLEGSSDGTPVVSPHREVLHLRGGAWGFPGGRETEVSFAQFVKHLQPLGVSLTQPRFCPCLSHHIAALRGIETALGTSLPNLNVSGLAQIPRYYVGE